MPRVLSLEPAERRDVEARLADAEAAMLSARRLTGAALLDSQAWT